MTAALVATIWLALLAFVAMEAGRRPARSGLTSPRWLDAVSLAGLILLIVHIGLAYAVRHGWSHDAALRATAEQTASVYGLNWGGGIYINYLFAVVWAIDAWLWSASPIAAAGRAAAVRWALRVFYGLIIVNGAVIFVPGPRRLLGVSLVLALIWIWRPVSSR